MTVWFTSDHHFGHKNIINHCNRPFDNVDNMNKYMIQEWNRRVAADDLVYYLGDFTMKKQSPWIEQLKGRKILIRGNHDHRKGIKTDEWDDIYHYLEASIDGDFVVMCHYPIESWNRMNRGSIHLHGHSHGHSRYVKHRVDVGVDSWAFCPVTLKQIKGAPGYD